MSPRPRETSNEAILAATARVMQRRSPTQLTLADVAKEAGVVPATLIQHINSGAMLSWAVYRQGPVAAWVRRDLEQLLAPYRTKTRTKARRLSTKKDSGKFL